MYQMKHKSRTSNVLHIGTGLQRKLNWELGEGSEGKETKGMENMPCIDAKSSYYEKIKGYCCRMEICKEEAFGHVVLEM